MDPSLFILDHSSYIIYLFVYVDGIIISRANESVFEIVLERLGKEFPIRDLGDLNFFLRIQVQWIADGLHLSQTRYLMNLL